MRGAPILLLTSMKLKNGKKEFISSIATTSIFLQFVLDSNAILITYGSRLNFTK